MGEPIPEPVQAMTQDRVWFFETFPCRPRPYPGECLSGYLLRLAEANGLLRFSNLMRDLFPMRQNSLHLSRLSWEYPIAEWGRIPLRTQVSLADLKRLTVVSWLEKFRSLPAVTLDGYLGPGLFLRGVVNPRLQVCPLCLQEQRYLQLMWRLTPVRVCLRHGCWLQTECPKCGHPLTPMGPWHRHLCCPHCATDLRGSSVVTAPADVLAAQERQQAELQFLLDPNVTLVKIPDSTTASADLALRQAIGLKFWYLRHQSGQSHEEIAERMGVSDDRIVSLERGSQTPLPFYLTYLEKLRRSWAELAALEVPQEFVEHLQAIPYLSLRLCPTPGCPNHEPPPGLGVRQSADLPDQRIVRFRCAACKRTFTRSYDGELVTKQRRPPIRPGAPPTVPKSAEEIAELTQMGLQGRDTREIAHRLGWSEKTVRMYWIALDREDQVHRAQAQRREQEQQQHRAQIRERAQEILNSLLDQDAEITLRHLGRALGYNADYLHRYPELAGSIQTAIQQHNAEVRQRRHDAVLTRITQVAEDSKDRDDRVTMQTLAEQAELNLATLRQNYPDLHTLVRQVVRDHQACVKAARLEDQCARINAAVTRLVAQGIRLTYGTICREAGLNGFLAYVEPTIHDLLRQWVGDLASCD